MSLKEIESAIERQLSFHNGPAPITIDILLYDDTHIAQEDQPRSNARAVALVSLAEIAPTAIDPITGIPPEKNGWIRSCPLNKEYPVML